MMADFLIASDSGNGSTNAVLAQKKNYKSVAFPSVRAAVTGDTLGIANEQKIPYSLWGGSRYTVGDSVVLSGRQPEQHGGSNRYGNELHQFLTAQACAELGVKGSDKDPATVHLIQFAPPKFYAEAKASIASGYLSNGGLTSIQLSTDTKPRVWRYTQVDVFPEGLAAAACLGLDDSGQPVKTDLLSGDVLVLDGGMNTIDAVRLKNGSFVPEDLQHATWAKTGIQFQILQPILNYLQKRSNDFAPLTIHHLDHVLRSGLQRNDWILHDGIHNIDLQKMFAKQAESMASFVSNQIIDTHFDNLDGIRSLLVVGGWSALVLPHLQKWYNTDREKVLVPAGHKHLKSIHPVDFNVVGGLRLALNAQLEGAKS